MALGTTWLRRQNQVVFYIVNTIVYNVRIKPYAIGFFTRPEKWHITLNYLNWYKLFYFILLI